MKHLSVRVAWHDNKWNGTVCSNPSNNSYCIHLPRIYVEKNDSENDISNKSWSKLESFELPPCKAEGGGFMNPTSYKRSFEHPYSKNKNVPHNVLLETEFEVVPYSLFVTPYRWMLSNRQWFINEKFRDIPHDEKAPFETSWIYGRERQKKVLESFFGEIEERSSLIVFYTKSGNPIDEDAKRIVLGIGLVDKKSPILEYKSTSNYTYSLWDRLITHTIRENVSESEGLLIPYHEYLNLPDDFKKGDKTKLDLIEEIKLTFHETEVSENIIEEFSYGTEWVENSSILNLLSQLRVVVERIKEHGIVKGNWDNQLKWISEQIGQVKKKMGPFPSFANALFAIKFKYSHFLEKDLRQKGLCQDKDNPWLILEKVLSGKIDLGKTEYSSELKILKDIWYSLSNESKKLLIMLSRFELSYQQIRRWFNPELRREFKCNVTDIELLENPYIISEDDIGEIEYVNDETKEKVKRIFPKITPDTLDLGLFKDNAIQGEYLPEEPYLVESNYDIRRVRAFTISLLNALSEEGDTLLSIEEINSRLGNLKLQRSVDVPSNYIKTHLDFMKEKLEHISNQKVDALQLSIYKKMEDFLRKIFLGRTKKEINKINEDWENLIVQAVTSSGIEFDKSNKRHINALEDQKDALSKITSTRLSVLNGSAGTGKTTVMGALFRCDRLRKEGILLLAPTGKARVRLGKMANSEAFTIAQFLTKQARFDWARMKVKFEGDKKYRGEANIVIDECSMLTIEDFYALFNAIDLTTVKRVILVGDPHQLPPIGAGRPFADLCNYLQSIEKKDIEDNEELQIAKDSLAKLEVIVRSRTNGDSDTLNLASWFSGNKNHKNADEIFSKIGNNDDLNDLYFQNWKDEKDLELILKTLLVKELNLKNEKDYEGFNKSLGGTVDEIKKNPENLESHQILTPVKNPAWGSFNINRIVQFLFRTGFKKQQKSVGEQLIGPYDKVIQLKNERRVSFPNQTKEQLSNGQIGMVHNTSKYINITFSGYPNQTFGYYSSVIEDEGPAIELAYAITVHKSQGSDFNKVFLIIPEKSRLLSRELIYTALTRAKDKLIVLIQGNSPHWIFKLSDPNYSVTAKRSTNLFSMSIREKKDTIPYIKGLIHKTLKDNLLVRSKSEVIIANMLVERDIDFEYEKIFKNEDTGEIRIPDFSFADPSGDLIILEHLGMMNKESYREEWNKKLEFYKKSGFKVGKNLFITQDNEDGSIDSKEIEKVIEKIADLL